LVPHIEGANRDPKVIYCEELNCYVMALYIDRDEYSILKSDNLTEWSEIERISIKGDDECPDFFPLTDAQGNRRWVLIGASDIYLVGNFKEGIFVPEQQEHSLHYGIAAYAGQSFSNLPGERRIRITWQQWNVQGTNFSGQMGFPMEMSLSKVGETFYLQAQPIKEIETIYKESAEYRDIVLTPGREFRTLLEDAPYYIKLRGEMPKSGVVECTVFGRIIKMDFAQNKLKLPGKSAPLTVAGQELDVILLIDRCSIEAFVDGGKAYTTVLSKETVCDRNLPVFGLKSSEEINISSIELHRLASIWESAVVK